MSLWANALPNREDQLEIKRHAIIREAAKVFSGGGVHGISLEDVAERLGVPKAALYRDVPSKQDLLYACHKEAMAIAYDSLDAAEAEGQTGLEKIRQGMARYMREMIGTIGVPVMILEENALTGAQAAETMKLRDAFEHRMRRVVEEGIKDGSIIKIHPKLAVFTLLGAVHWVTKWYSPDGAWSAEDVSEALIEVATRGFAAKPGSELKASLKG